MVIMERYQHDELLKTVDKNISDAQKSLENLRALRLKFLIDQAKLWSNLSGSTAQKIQQDSSKKKKNNQEGKNKAVKDEFDADEDNHLALDDSEGDDDARACFPCPFCYVDIEIPLLCGHLQEEHCFDLKNAVCPLCAANLGKDVIGHFIVQHANSLKRRRKSQKSGLWTGSSATLGKESRELNSFLGSKTYGRGNAHDSAPDPLLSPFLYSIPLSEPKGFQQDKRSSNNASVTNDVKSTEPSPDEGHEQDNEERRQRAEFVQQLIASTIF